MLRHELLEILASQIAEITTAHPTRVAIDGPDAAGKTTLADELAILIGTSGRAVIRASIDGFHNPESIRYQRGRLSPEGYYFDSFNHESLITLLLSPLGPQGSREYRHATFDYRTDLENQRPFQIAQATSVLLFDGVFLLRPELADFWDFAIFLDVGFEVTLARAQQRDAIAFGGVDTVTHRYEQRYIPGQKLYFDLCRPRVRANIVVDNNLPSAPTIVLNDTL